MLAASEPIHNINSYYLTTAHNYYYYPKHCFVVHAQCCMVRLLLSNWHFKAPTSKNNHSWGSNMQEVGAWREVLVISYQFPAWGVLPSWPVSSYRASPVVLQAVTTY